MSEPSRPDDIQPDSVQPDGVRPDDVESENEGEGLDSEVVKPFLDHLEDFRWMIIRMTATVVASMALCFGFGKYIFAIIRYPLSYVTDEPETYLFTPFEVAGSFTLAIKLAFYAGLVLSAPLLLYFLLDFILPALTPREKKMLRPGLIGGTFLFMAGVALAYFAAIPAALKFFDFHNRFFFGRPPQWTTVNYVGFVTQVMLGFGIAFEFPLLVLILAKLGIVTHSFLHQKRPVVIVVICIISAVVTPADVLSMLILAIPLCLLYEVCIWIAWWMERKSETQS